MKLFNLNYLKQNFKKSKVILSIFTCLIPILNTIILIMTFNNNDNYVFGFSEVSIINFIGVYILPIIVSICLFNYIFKKKSVDFINSMPISRRSVFVTNTIFGILIFLSMLVVNLLLMTILTSIFNIPIPFMMMFEYLWYWFIVYIFAFSATNLAMTVSGNAITQVVVTLLLVFLIPFTHMFINVLSSYNTINKTYLECDKEECIPDKYYCYDDLECNINKNANIYKINLDKQIKNNYTSLFGYFYMMFTGENNSIINVVSIIKMVILSILYTVVGYILFIRRKMEVSETSFKNIHVHNVVRALTLVPIVAFAYIICRYASFFEIMFVLVIILIYYIVYDLIIRKSISNIKLSLIYFIVAISTLTIFYSVVEMAGNKSEKEILKYSDIKEVAVDISIHSSGYYDSNMDKLYIENKELIDLIINNSFNDYENKDRNYYLEVYLKTKDNTKYSETINMTKEDYYKIIDILSNNKEYVNYYKNIDFDKVYAVKVGGNLYKKNDVDAILKLVKESLSNLTLKELFDLQKKYNNVSDNFYISLYTYENHDRQEFRINGYINYDLLNSIVNSNNEVLRENISYVIPEDYSIYYSDMYVVEDFDINYYVLRNAKMDIYNFIIKELENSVDMKKEFITLEINFNSDRYLFTTNNVRGFKEILDKKYEEIKNTEEYKNYYGIDVDYDKKYSVTVEEYNYDY